MQVCSLIDSHCHLDDPRFDADLCRVIERAAAAGVQGFLIAGVDGQRWQRGLRLAEGCPGVGLALGLHPWVASRSGTMELEDALEELSRTVKEGRACALGETGLDGLHAEDEDAWSRQEHAFRVHLELARDHGLPLVIHAVRCHPRVLGLLRRAGELPGGVIHGYSGGEQDALGYLRLGFCLGLGPALTRPRPGRLLRVAASCPVDRVLLETDAPDRPVHSMRGRRGEPAHLPVVLQAVAHARGEDPTDLARVTTANARRLFARAPWGDGR